MPFEHSQAEQRVLPHNCSSLFLLLKQAVKCNMSHKVCHVVLIIVVQACIGCSRVNTPSCSRLVSTGNLNVNALLPPWGVTLGRQGTRGPCVQGGEDNYGEKASIIYARLSLERAQS